METKLIKTGNDFLLKDVNGETLAITSGTIKGKMLSLKNCQAIELGYDLDEYIAFELQAYIAEKHNQDECTGFMDGYEIGFQKALELFGDKKYSEEDVLNLLSDYGYDLIHADNLFEGTPKEWMDKIKQQTEWNVEIEMIPAMSNNGNVYYGDIPKLDADGCLILKRK